MRSWMRVALCIGAVTGKIPNNASDTTFAALFGRF